MQPWVSSLILPRIAAKDETPGFVSHEFLIDGGHRQGQPQTDQHRADAPLHMVPGRGHGALGRDRGKGAVATRTNQTRCARDMNSP